MTATTAPIVVVGIVAGITMIITPIRAAAVVVGANDDGGGGGGRDWGSSRGQGNP